LGSRWLASSRRKATESSSQLAASNQASELSEQLRQERLDVQAMTLDVIDQASILSCVTQMKEQYGALDIPSIMPWPVLTRID
jgi:hypothetical protein